MNLTMLTWHLHIMCFLVILPAYDVIWQWWLAHGGSRRRLSQRLDAVTVA